MFILLLLFYYWLLIPNGVNRDAV